MAAVFLVITLAAGYALFAGLRSQEMSAMGVPYGVWRRTAHPMLFWLASLFNLMVMLAGLLLSFEELAK